MRALNCLPHVRGRRHAFEMLAAVGATTVRSVRVPHRVEAWKDLLTLFGLPVSTREPNFTASSHAVIIRAHDVLVKNILGKQIADKKR